MEIQLRNIHKRFGAVHANNDINVTFPRAASPVSWERTALASPRL